MKEKNSFCTADGLADRFSPPLSYLRDDIVESVDAVCPESTHDLGLSAQ